VRQHPPGTPATGQIQDGVHDLPYRIRPGPADGASGLREQVLDVVPLEVRQVARVSLPCRGAHAKTVTSARIPAKAHFLDGQSGKTALRGPRRLIFIVAAEIGVQAPMAGVSTPVMAGVTSD
jgi:hypothetical protein